MLGDPQQRRPCTMYQLAPQVMIGSVPDTTEPWLSAGRVLSRNQSNPGRKGSAGCEVSAIVNCGDEGGCDNRSYPRQRSQTFATIVSPADINRSEERRVGNEGVRTCRCRGRPG